MKNKDNPTNSSVLQSLLDLKTIAIANNDDDLVRKTVDLINELSQKKTRLLEADKKFNAHKYNESKMDFVKLSNIKKNQMIHSLSLSATRVYLFICQAVSQDNLIELHIENTGKFLGLSKPTMIKSLCELVDFGCITLIQSANKKGKTGSIYMLNPDICYSGKSKNQARFDSDVNQKEQSRLDTYELSKSQNCSFRDSLYTCSDGTQLSCRTVIYEE